MSPTLILGYSGSGRENHDSRRRLFSLKKAAMNKSFFDSFLSFSDDDEEVPINYFPLKGLGHDCAASLLYGGETVASVAEERFNRMKHSVSLKGSVMLPKKSIGYCLSQAGAHMRDVDFICYYLNMSEGVFNKRLDILSAFLPESVKEKVVKANRLSYEREFSSDQVYRELIRTTGHEWGREKVKFIPHHFAHAGSAYYSSGFEDCGILTLDGYGEVASSVFAIGSGNKLHVIEETEIPTSLGILYMIMTVFLGFKPLSDEYKVMGLASYGNPKRYEKEFQKLIRIGNNGGYDTAALVREDFKNFIEDMFGKPREEKAEITRREMDIAASLQKALEECTLYKLKYLKERHGFENLCLSGGVALNCALNGKLAKSGLFKNIYIFPASGDDGCSLGAAQYFFYNILDPGSKKRKVTSFYLGPEYSDDEVSMAMDKYMERIRFSKKEDIEDEVARLLVEQKVVGWFQGRMEFGPRALGNRSILADPRNPDMKDIINEKVKKRETFRPFAPAVKLESAKMFFELGDLGESPYMLFIVPVKEDKRELIPAITHCDGTARIQTVRKEDNFRFWRLLDCFERHTGIPIVLNTSFNVKGEPIVCSPEDAVRCFLGTNIDALVIGNYLIEKIEKRNSGGWNGQK